MAGTELNNNIAVRICDLHKKYKDGPEATRGIDLSVSCGEALSILGPNGAGKTTFLRQLTTELKPSSGSVQVFGIDAVKFPRRAKAVMGVTPQDAGLFETLTVDEHIELFGRLKGLGRSASRESTTEILLQLDLNAVRRQRVGSLSGGQKRRILIGLAMIGNPLLLVLDEPTTGLDPASRKTVWAMLKKVVAGGTTLILSTHYIEEAENISHRVAFINHGQITSIGTVDELRRRFARRFRLTIDKQIGRADKQTIFFDTFKDVQKYLGKSQPLQYEIAAASLEDVYFSVVGERIGTDSNGDRFIDDQ